MTARVAGVEISTEHWIGGKRVPSRETFADLSPIDGAHLADVSAGGAAEVDAAVAAARAAFPGLGGARAERPAADPAGASRRESRRAPRSWPRSRPSTTARSWRGTCSAWCRAPR